MDGAEEINNKISEYYTLDNRLERYWKRLMKESLTIAYNHNT